MSEQIDDNYVNGVYVKADGTEQVEIDPQYVYILRRLRFDEGLKNHVSGTTHSSKPAGCMEAPILSVSPGYTCLLYTSRCV